MKRGIAKISNILHLKCRIIMVAITEKTLMNAKANAATIVMTGNRTTQTHEEIGNSSGKRKRWVSDDDEDYNDLDHYDGASEGQDHASFKSPAEKRSRVPNEDENKSGMTTYNKLTNDSKPKPMGQLPHKS